MMTFGHPPRNSRRLLSSRKDEKATTEKYKDCLERNRLRQIASRHDEVLENKEDSNGTEPLRTSTVRLGRRPVC